MRKKHLTLSERLVIERMLNERRSFADMAREIGKDRSTISREVRNHSYEKKMGCHGRAHNDCRHADACNITGNCKDRYICGRKTCRSCPRGCGAKLCRYFERRYCSHLKKVPYVCNGCRKAGSCTLTKVLYSAVRADEQYRSDLSYYRTGIALTKTDAMEIQKEILPLFEQGQSVYAAMKSCGSRIPFSVKTMYTYIDSGVFPDIKNIDLPRKVRYRGRKKKKDAEGRRKDNWYRDGRRMEDFERFLADNPSVAIVEMDTVEGPRSERRCLLTLQFLTSSLQLAFLRESNSRESVLAIFDDLKRKLGRDDFRKLFQVILTDNGSEFSDPEHIEIAEDGEMLTNVFYCHPLASWEKGDCENNHTLIRRVIPKGRSLSGLSQEDISRMMDHINSYPRAQYNGRSAYDMFVFLNGEEVAKKLGLERVHPRNVTLKPELI